jgi:hypothetical protein
MEKKEQLYNIQEYSEEELYDILDLSDPTDRELEAKILFMIHKYQKTGTKASKKLVAFFEDIYDYFFQGEEEEEQEENYEQEPSSQEGFTNLNTIMKSKDQEVLKDTFSNENTLVKNNKEKTEEKSDEQEPPVVYTQELTYSKGILNPILKQTTKRIVSIDSQYRPDKNTFSTSFVVNLSEPLKDVVSLKLYSVQIPNTWYTIGKSFGSNLVYIKGRTPGIDNDTHDIKLEIEAGNYKPDELVNTLNTSLNEVNPNIDTDLSGSAFSYNRFTSLCKFTGNLKKQYTEGSFYVNFPTWESPYQEEENRNNTLPSYLGFQTTDYYLNILRSPLYYALENTNLNVDTNTQFTINTNNNYFTIIQYYGTFPYSPSNSIVDVQRNIQFSFPPGTYTRGELIDDLNTQIQNDSDFYDSYLQRKNTDTNNNLYAALVSYMELKIKFSRTVMNQTIKSKTIINFPNDESIWIGPNSCFRFDLSNNELDEVFSDLSPVKQSDRYTVENNPYVTLTCIEDNFNNGLNDFTFTVPNSIAGTAGYTIQEYMNAINEGIRITDASNNNVLNAPTVDYTFDSQQNIYPTGTFAFIKDNKMNIHLDIDLTFNEELYEIDLTNSIFTTGSIVLQDDNGNALNESTLTLSDLTQTYIAKANIGTRIIPGNQIICSVKPKQSATNGNKDDVTYVITLADSSDTITFDNYPALQDVINQRFANYIDPISNKNIFSGTTLTTLGIIDGVYQINFNVNVTKSLITRNYSIQFFDPNSEDTWKKFLFLDSQMVDSAFSMNYAIPDSDYNITNENGSAIARVRTTGDLLLTAADVIATSNTLVIEAGINDSFSIIAYENGVASTGNENNLTVTIPAGVYSTEYLIETMNNSINNVTSTTTQLSGSTISLITRNGEQYVKLKTNLTRTYDAKDFNVVFYDEVSFIQCFSGANSAQNTTWDSTVGWILGFREFTAYDLSVYNNETTNVAIITGDTGASTSLYNYFLICLDDYNQNRLNDGLVTVTGADNDLPLPSYAKRSEYFCDPTTGDLVYNNTAGLTEKQIYAANEIANSKNTNLSIGSSITASSYGRGPFATDVFGLIPVKTSNLAAGAPYVEFGGTLQNQERVYFGPVNIQRMGIRLITDKGNPLDLNNANWSFSLVCEQLNKLEPSK